MREKEEKEFQLMIEIEEEKRKQQEYASEQVRKVKVSSVLFHDLLICSLFAPKGMRVNMNKTKVMYKWRTSDGVAEGC